jgi:hypothetical protein
MYKTEASTGLILIGILVLSCLSTSIFNHDQASAQQYIQTIKYRNLVIDLGNGIKTNAQLTYPAVGKGPFPGVLLIHGVVLMIRMKHSLLEVLNHLHHFGR